MVTVHKPKRYSIGNAYRCEPLIIFIQLISIREDNKMKAPAQELTLYHAVERMKNTSAGTPRFLFITTTLNIITGLSHEQLREAICEAGLRGVVKYTTPRARLQGYIIESYSVFDVLTRLVKQAEQVENADYEPNLALLEQAKYF